MLGVFKKKNKKHGKKTEIHVLIDEGGIFQGCYVTPDLVEASVYLMDFVTDDPDEQDEVEKEYNKVQERAKKGELICIF